MATSTTAARTPNYSDSAVATMIAEYSAEPTRTTVDALARQFNKNSRSIIAKLVREGVYKAVPRVTKTGTPVVRKSAIVSQITNSLNLSEGALNTLEKASKSDLAGLLEAITENVVA